ncbi:MAG: CDP-alcohol phosphatidyltransferase family protein [Saprospiraceae bacterium]|nr:CDP-alcohol phosphatidyltransferase family protein [Saprospiraceae bacterium]
MANNWKDKGQKFVYGIINPFINLLIKIGITPNMITFVGLIMNVLASIVLIYGAEKGERMDHRYVGLAGFIILLGGLMDMVDGRLARVGNMSSDYGALFDSVLDRYSEMVMFLGICYYLVSYDYFLSSLFAFIAMIGSVMVSYTRARAEGLGVNASVGIMQRPERILLIGISALACGIFSNMYGGDFKRDLDGLPFPLFETITIFTLPIFILAIMANVTAIRRLLHARNTILKP